MSLLRTAAKSRPRLIEIAHQHQGLASVVRHSQNRLLSTEAQSNFDPFLKTPPSGSVYARLYGSTRYTSKTDILNLLAGCNLSPDDLKHDYNQNYSPLPVLIRFPSRQAYDVGIKSIVRKGRFRLEPEDGSKWDYITPYDGKAILLQGIPRNALPEDIERFLSGCPYDASSMQIFYRPSMPFPTRMALVRFPSQALAMHAFITKNRGFCLNNQILVRVLH